VPVHDPLKPIRSPWFDARAAFRRLRRVVMIAPALGFLLALAAAGAASAADGLDVADAAKAAPDKATTVLTPATDRLVQTVVDVVKTEPVGAALTIVGGAGDRVNTVVDPVAPVPIPPVVLLAPFDGPVRGVGPRRPEPSAVGDSTPPAAPSADVTPSLAPTTAPAPAATAAFTVDDGVLLRPMQPVMPFDSFGAIGDVALASSGFGVGPWLGQVPPVLPGFAWRSTLRPPVALSIPRGLTPLSLVPPG
jgi:hypothetical protein